MRLKLEAIVFEVKCLNREEFVVIGRLIPKAPDHDSERCCSPITIPMGGSFVPTGLAPASSRSKPKVPGR